MPVFELLGLVISCFAAYLLGSACAAMIVAALLGLPDPRTQGSGNPGASNMLRLYGKLPAALTLLGDMLKGVLPVLLGRLLDWPPLAQGVLALSAVIGHAYPVFFNFRGGKGIATAGGALLALDAFLGLAIMAVWAGVFAVTRVASLASLAASAATPLYCYFYLRNLLLIGFALLGFSIFRHMENILRLMDGSERNFRKPK